MRLVYLFILSMIAIDIASQTYVDIDAVGGTNDGSSWTDAYTSLNTALNNAIAGDEIWVAEGTYIPNAHPRNITGSPALTDRDFTFHLVNGVAMYGGFNGTETSKSQRNVNGFPTILSGEIDEPNTVYSIHVVLSVSDNSSTILDGFTITKGLPISPTDPPITVEGQVISRQNGSGMYNASSQPTMDSLTFFENVNIHGMGGGMFNDASSPDIKNTTYDTNYASHGAGLCNVNGSIPSLLKVDFMSNNGIKGVGMYNDASSPLLTSCSFQLNTLGNFNNSGNLSVDGVGMYNTNASSPTLSLTLFRINQSPNGNGAGMYNHNSNPTLNNVQFVLNLSVNGGGMYNSSSSPILNHVHFFKNLASENGGGIYNLNSAPMINHCSVGSNSADLGGGIYNDASSPELDSGDISGNVANVQGGGMYNTNSSTPDIEKLNFIGNKVLYPLTGLFTKNGGGMYNLQSSPILTEVQFVDNEASNGGGMYNHQSSPSLANVEFKSNEAFYKGGGMNNDNTSSPTLFDVSFINNQTRHNEYSLNFDAEYINKYNRGGGMHNDNGSSPSLTNVRFENNESNYGGGMSIDNGSSPTLENVAFTNNEAREGGGLFNMDSSPSITNVSFSGNRARGFTFKKFLNGSIVFDLEYFRHKGGGMYNEGNLPLIMTNVVFNENVAEEDSFYRTNNVGPPVAIYLRGQGGGFYNKNPFGTSSNITINNATFNQNIAENINNNGPTGVDIYNESNHAITLNNSLLMKGFYVGNSIYGTLDELSATGSNNVMDSRFNPAGIELVNIGLPVGRDLTWGTADDGLRPAFGSSIINAGNNSLNSEALDITGQSRIIGGTIDIGAYEFTECNGTTEFISGNWTNGPPTPSMNAVFKDDYNTLDPGKGTILACTCTVEAGKTLTIGDKTALHVYFNGINIFGSIIVEEGGSIINGIWSGQ